MRLVRFFTVTLIAAALDGCVCRTAEISPRLPLGSPPSTPDAMLGVVEQRAQPPETLQMQAHVVAQGKSLIGRRAFDINLLWRRPDQTRLRLSRPGPGTVFEVLQRGDTLTLLDPLNRQYFSGPIEDLDPAILVKLPLDATAMVTVPLIDEAFAERLPHLRLAEAPRGSCWRGHLFLQGDPSNSESKWWQTYQDEIWAVRPATLTVEGLALRLPNTVSAKPLWLWLVFDRYAEVQQSGLPDHVVLPSEFSIALARRPWRRWRRGEIWSLTGKVTLVRLSPALQDQAFEMPPPRGVEVTPLRDLIVR
jgi:hypothetical protein